jgi:homoserine O-acetyltransferase/O-succinyltransferase
MMIREGSIALGNVPLHAGGVLPEARLLWKSFGTLNADHSNAILYPTSYGAQHSDLDWLIKADGILDPTRWFIIQVNQFGNGLSTSPSHLIDPAPAFTVSHVDNVRAQERLLRESFGIERLALVYGWSMGAQQAYHWAVMFPDRVARIAALCGTARTSEHNRLFLMSLESALLADPTWNGHRFDGIPERGFRTFARIYASWAASQEFYRRREYLQQGYTDLDDYLARAWEPFYRKRDPMDHLAMLRTWMRSDVGMVMDGDTRQALRSIRARTLVMPSTTDLYFTVDDCAAEAALIPGAQFRPLHSWLGHRAGNPVNSPADTLAIRRAIDDLLAR